MTHNQTISTRHTNDDQPRSSQGRTRRCRGQQTTYAYGPRESKRHKGVRKLKLKATTGEETVMDLCMSTTQLTLCLYVIREKACKEISSSKRRPKCLSAAGLVSLRPVRESGALACTLVSAWTSTCKWQIQGNRNRDRSGEKKAKGRERLVDQSRASCALPVAARMTTWTFQMNIEAC